MAIADAKRRLAHCGPGPPVPGGIPFPRGARLSSPAGSSPARGSGPGQRRRWLTPQPPILRFSGGPHALPARELHPAKGGLRLRGRAAERARLERDAARLNPEGPRILVTGDVKLTDADIVFRTLDRIHGRHPDMVLVHKGSAGAESIAGMWARLRGVDAMIVRTDWSLGKRAPFRANDAMLALKPKAIGAVIFGGGGVAANLAQKAHAQRIPVMTAIEPAVAALARGPAPTAVA